MINVELTRPYGKQLVYFFRFFPPYNIGEGLIAMSTAYFSIAFLGKKVSYLSWGVAGMNLSIMAAETVGYFGIMLLIESSLFQRMINFIQHSRSLAMESPPPRKTPEDDDVTTEANRISHCDLSNDDNVLVIQSLIKTYPSGFFYGPVKHAVRGMSLGISKGERFGLLGINGKDISLH
jgi:hypothetical protein